MRLITYLSMILLTAVSCQKEISAPIETVYATLAPYDSLGKPSNLLPRDVISKDMLKYIDSLLPEMGDITTTHPELLNNLANSDIVVTKTSDVYITFVSQVTDRTSAIAFYTYPTKQPPTNKEDIKKFTYVFPNAGQYSKLRAGDKVKIGRFEPGTSIGIVLLPRAWDRSRQTLLNDAAHFMSNDFLNPEDDPGLKKHVILLNYPTENKILMPFEDADRSDPYCDHDFNDVVIYATIAS